MIQLLIYDSFHFMSYFIATVIKDENTFNAPIVINIFMCTYSVCILLKSIADRYRLDRNPVEPI